MILSIDMCTASAKAIYAKSRRYGADFKLMCKSLQQNATINGAAEEQCIAKWNHKFVHVVFAGFL
jgi:hypothetical protein